MKRFWEIDFFRGIAIILMIVFNYAFALRFFDVFQFDSYFFWFVFPRVVGGMFIVIAGISLALSSRRKPATSLIKRGIKIFSLGLLITAVTWLAFPDIAVWFGILHLIGLSIILGTAFLRFRSANLAIAAASVIAGVYLSTLAAELPWLLWLGLAPENFATLDYFPMLPWFGVFLAGVFIGNRFYAAGKRRFKIKERKPVVCMVGRHSLVIYMLHIPILLAALYILGIIAI